MIEKNDIICALTTGIGSNGEGIVKHEGITFFVPACLPGEKIRFRVLQEGGAFRYSGIVDQNVHRAEFLFCFLAETAALFFIGNIEAFRINAAIIQLIYQAAHFVFTSSAKSKVIFLRQ